MNPLFVTLSEPNLIISPIPTFHQSAPLSCGRNSDFPTSLKTSISFFFLPVCVFSCADFKPALFALNDASLYGPGRRPLFCPLIFDDTIYLLFKQPYCSPLRCVSILALCFGVLGPLFCRPRMPAQSPLTFHLCSSVPTVRFACPLTATYNLSLHPLWRLGAPFDPFAAQLFPSGLLTVFSVRIAHN